jgi:hypothetical protein
MTTPITSKTQMYALLRRGAFGNTFQIWDNADDFAASGFRDLVGVRCSNKPGAPYYPHLTPHQGLMMAALVEERGLEPVIYEASPDQLITLQGELADFSEGFQLTYSTRRCSMREALREPSFASGKRAELLVRRAVTASDWADIEAIFTTWPGHVVEFTAYSSPVGNLRGRRAIVWEVRSY